MGMKAQIGFMLHGPQRTAALMSSVASYEDELRDLQRKVEALTAVVTRIDAALALVDAESTEASSALRTELRSFTDDLGDRIGALDRRLDFRL
jgi:hypothetical protein